MMKKFGMIIGLIAVLMCVPEMAWAEASSVRVDAQEVPVNGNWYGNDYDGLGERRDRP